MHARLISSPGNDLPAKESKHRVPQDDSGRSLVVSNLRVHAGSFLSRALIISGCIVIVLLAAGAILVYTHWPFTEAAVRSDLASATSSDVRFGRFHTHYFPPSCVAESVTFREASETRPAISIRKLTITATLGDLLRHRLRLIKAEGLHGKLVHRSPFSNASSSVHAIDRLIADDAVLEIPSRGQQQSLQFRFHKLSISNLTVGGVISFVAVLDLPLPAGLASISGQFGPWRSGDSASTPISGKYSLERADLGVFHSIGGEVSSDGTFRGDLKQIGVDGYTHSPNFTVATTQHSLPLNTSFHASVDVQDGNVVLPHFMAQFGRDQITGSGSVARRNDGKRSTLLDLNCTRGRIEDTFYPFIESARSPLTGDTNFRMKIALASGHGPFLQKLRLDSDFHIENARFTNSQTETRLSKVSAPPNQDESNESAQLQGNVLLTNGVARFSELTIHDDGASAAFHGSYAVHRETIDLHGDLKTAASLAKTSHGMKAIFAKVIETFYKKSPHVTVVPVHIGGTYSHPNFGLDL